MCKRVYSKTPWTTFQDCCFNVQKDIIYISDTSDGVRILFEVTECVSYYGRSGTDYWF